LFSRSSIPFNSNRFTADDANSAVEAASKAFPRWSSLTIKARASYMLKFHALVQAHAKELAELIVLENGKNVVEALADVAKGNETVEWACCLPQVAQGNVLRVSSEVTCEDRRTPLGVVASIVPFNFPLMVPMWTVPIALVLGNTVVLKPSEKVPLTMRRVAELFEEAGFPDGVFNMVQGTKVAVDALMDHPDVKAVTFVGSSPVANIVATRCRALNKRVTALGGAKNHLVVLPDCEVDGASSDICVSFAGCAGQRCMAASVLLLIGPQEELLNQLVDKASKLRPGSEGGQVGPVIDEASYRKIISYIDDAEKSGVKILLDGRSWKREKGNWVGPTILLHESSDDRAIKEEIFGPVISVYVCKSWEEAIRIENANPFGNAASIYTTSGGNAEWFASRFRASMLGVNVRI
jgi:malonate-semialdehyde dehydrogenase (acetylating) / methylmalonate-semialdehyde dehydrogenase